MRAAWWGEADDAAAPPAATRSSDFVQRESVRRCSVFCVSRGVLPATCSRARRVPVHLDLNVRTRETEGGSARLKVEASPSVVRGMCRVKSHAELR